MITSQNTCNNITRASPGAYRNQYFTQLSFTLITWLKHKPFQYSPEMLVIELLMCADVFCQQKLARTSFAPPDQRTEKMLMSSSQVIARSYLMAPLILKTPGRLDWHGSTQRLKCDWTKSRATACTWKQCGQEKSFEIMRSDSWEQVNTISWNKHWN